MEGRREDSVLPGLSMRVHQVESKAHPAEIETPATHVMAPKSAHEAMGVVTGSGWEGCLSAGGCVLPRACMWGCRVP